MRIRQVRPEFWTDSTVAAWQPAVRLFYIGLWCVADDFGWLRWNETELGALLFPYESPKRRQRDVEGWAQVILTSGRVVAFQCGCGHIPTLERHQVNGGRKSAIYRDKHLNEHHSNARVRIVPDIPEIPPVGKGSNGNASGTDVPEPPTDVKNKLRYVDGKWVA